MAGKFDRHDTEIIFIVVSNRSSAEVSTVRTPNTKILFAYAAFIYLSTIGYRQSIF